MNADNTFRTMVITGAGGGVGQAVAQRFAEAGWKLVLVGRGRDKLEAVATQLPADSVMIHPCDVSDANQVADLVEAVLLKFGGIDALVNVAGINIPNRKWTDIDPGDFDRVIAINLKGAFNCMRSMLPTLRKRQGTIVNINSEAGRRATAKAGCAYVAAKYGLAGLTESINAEERLNGLRAISVFPGEINTTLLDQRPEPPPESERLKMVQPEDVAECVWTAVNLPKRTLIEELVVRPTLTDYQ